MLVVILKYSSSDHAAVILQQRDTFVEKVDRAAREGEAPFQLRLIGLPRFAWEAVARRTRYRRRRGYASLSMFSVEILSPLRSATLARVLLPEQPAPARNGARHGTQAPQGQKAAPRPASCSFNTLVHRVRSSTGRLAPRERHSLPRGSGHTKELREPQLRDVDLYLYEMIRSVGVSFASCAAPRARTTL